MDLSAFCVILKGEGYSLGAKTVSRLPYKADPERTIIQVRDEYLLSSPNPEQCGDTLLIFEPGPLYVVCPRSIKYQDLKTIIPWVETWYQTLKERYWYCSLPISGWARCCVANGILEPKQLFHLEYPDCGRGI